LGIRPPETEAQNMNLTVEQRRIALAILEHPNDNFVELVRISGLDPKVAFLGSDLRGLDFGTDDLSGFDFTGADLRGCKLTGVRGKESAIFVGALFSEGGFGFRDNSNTTELNTLKAAAGTSPDEVPAATRPDVLTDASIMTGHNIGTTPADLLLAKVGWRVPSIALRNYLIEWADWLQEQNLVWTSREPVREELFSIERLEEHARSLAVAQPVARSAPKVQSLSGRVRDNYRLLADAHRMLLKAGADGEQMASAGQWLIDNFHVVEAQIAALPYDQLPTYYRQLPKLADGPFAGYPRVFGLAWVYVAHTDSQLDTEMLCRFVYAY
jgi:hypothetical protein